MDEALTPQRNLGLHEAMQSHVNPRLITQFDSNISSNSLHLTFSDAQIGSYNHWASNIGTGFQPLSTPNSTDPIRSEQSSGDPFMVNYDSSSPMNMKASRSRNVESADDTESQSAGGARPKRPRLDRYSNHGFPVHGVTGSYATEDQVAIGPSLSYDSLDQTVESSAIGISSSLHGNRMPSMPYHDENGSHNQPSRSGGFSSVAVQLCCLWRCRNPHQTLTVADQDTLSELFNLPFHHIRNLSEANCFPPFPPSADSTGSFEQLGQPNPFTRAACDLWQKMNPNRTPSQVQLNSLRDLFHDTTSVILEWYHRTAAPGGTEVDSALGLSLDSNDTTDRMATFSDRRDASISFKSIAICPDEIKHEVLRSAKQELKCDRKHCTRNGRPSGRLDEIVKVRERPYICVECHQTWVSRTSWKRHLSKNHMQKFWICLFERCRRHDVKSRVWTSRTELVDHIKNNHGQVLDKSRISDYIHDWREYISHNFRRTCIFKNCARPFISLTDWIKHCGDDLCSQDWNGSQLRTEPDSSADTLGNLACEGSEDDTNDSESYGEDDSDADVNNSSNRIPTFRTARGSVGRKFQSASRKDSRNSYNSRQRSRVVVPVQEMLRTHRSLQPLPPSTPTEQRSKIDGSIIRKLSSYWDAPKMPKIQTIRILGCSRKSIVDEVLLSEKASSVARKRMTAKFAGWRDILQREIKNMSKLHHHHIVSLFRDPQPFDDSIFMRPVANFNLAEYLTNYTIEVDGQARLRQWLSCLAAGLEHMHLRGIRHQDIKPSNILIQGKLILYSDFGSSISVDDERRSNRAFEFTERYAAPEMFNSQPSSSSDVFSLGCVFLEIAAILVSKRTWLDLQSSRDEWQLARSFGSHWSRGWIERLHENSHHTPSECKISLLLAVCQAMTGEGPEQRPNAGAIEARICPELCPECSYRRKSASSLQSNEFFPKAITPRSTRHQTIDASVSMTVTSRQVNQQAQVPQNTVKRYSKRKRCFSSRKCPSPSRAWHTKLAEDQRNRPATSYSVRPMVLNNSVSQIYDNEQFKALGLSWRPLLGGFEAQVPHNLLYEFSGLHSYNKLPSNAQSLRLLPVLRTNESACERNEPVEV